MTAEVGLEAGLGIRLRHREANLAGGAEVNTPQVGGGGRAAQALQVGGSAGWPGYGNKDSCGGTKKISDRYSTRYVIKKDTVPYRSESAKRSELSTAVLQKKLQY